MHTPQAELPELLEALERPSPLPRTHHAHTPHLRTHTRAHTPQAELPELLEALDGATPAAAVPEALARELDDVQGIGGGAHLRGVRARGEFAGSPLRFARSCAGGLLFTRTHLSAPPLTHATLCTPSRPLDPV